LVFFEQLKTFQAANTQNHQKDQNLITFKDTFFKQKKSYKKLAKSYDLVTGSSTLHQSRFVHEHDLAVDSPSCGSRCGCNGAELEFADMEAENKLVVECREFEAELADMSQSFRRVN